MTDYDKVRALPECPLCNRPKLAGTVLCWPCHRDQKAFNGGGYNPATIEKLDALEASLQPPTAQSQKGAVLNSRAHKPR